jgi:hypothetical protein
VALFGNRNALYNDSRGAAFGVRHSGRGLINLYHEAVGNDRDIAAKPTKRPGKQQRMSKPSSRGGKGRCGRLRAALSLPVHLDVRNPY